MNASFMYHNLGIREQECTREEYQGGRTILHIRYDYRTSTGKIEGINNKIKTMKRQAYGFRDMEFFKLKIFALHDSTYAFSG